ncbi:RBBP9/YdeN family alpha/beta hydrolase [Corallococcus terminator]|uniref:Serine hydrolase family protein n=1 Tax=Corallococcus terminator TaxID=2316733 RepID=A0A3A8J1M7_9BACT|nr:alpha/beta hydrolase [Corallococcus terminator]RKG86084.1 hypothetical protein D7V88_18515 [Corallococcus terminator]
MTRSLVMVPRWAGSPDTDFYPWLTAKVRTAPALFDDVRALAMPTPSAPTVDGWVSTVASAVGPVPAPSTVFLGHSVGCQALMRYLVTLPPGHTVEGALFVAGWFEIDTPWDTLRPWLDTPLDFDRVRAALRRCVVLLSDSDPYTSDWRRNTRLFEERLGAEVRLIPGGRHFNNPQEPAVLEVLQERFASPE